MTKEERAVMKTKVAEANAKAEEMMENDKEKSKNWIFRVRGPPMATKSTTGETALSSDVNITSNENLKKINYAYRT